MSDEKKKKVPFAVPFDPVTCERELQRIYEKATLYPSGRRVTEVDLSLQLISHILTNHNDRNRNMKSGSVHKVDIALTLEGRLYYNGNDITFYKDRNLEDGQNRCEGALKAGVPLKKQLLVFDVEDDSIYGTDIGAKRTTTDTMNVRGELDFMFTSGMNAAIPVFILAPGATTREIHSLVDMPILRNPIIDEYPSIVYAHKFMSRVADARLTVGPDHSLAARAVENKVCEIALQRFFDEVNGIVDITHWPLKFRIWDVENPDCRHHGVTKQLQRYLALQTCLFNFINRPKLKKFTIIKDDIYPLKRDARYARIKALMKKCEG